MGKRMGPFWVFSHKSTFTKHKTHLIQGKGHPFGKIQKVFPDHFPLLIGLVLIDDGIVLIGFEGLFTPPFTAKHIGSWPDGGVDLLLTRGSEKFLVQCKQWRAFKVGVSVVRELYGVMAAQGAAAGIVVTSGSFTPDAVEYGSGRNVRLIDGPELQRPKAQLRIETDLLDALASQG